MIRWSVRLAWTLPGARLCARVGVLSACVWVGGPLYAQPQPEERSVLVPDSIKLSRLVDLVAEANKLQVSYVPADLDAMVTLRVQGGLTPQQASDLLGQVLASRGLATVHTPGSPVLSVVKIEQAAGASSVGPGVVGAGFITEVIEPRHTSAKVLIEAIKPLLSKPAGAAVALGDSQLIAVSDFTGRVREIQGLIERLDVADSVVTREVAVRHVSAAQVVALVTQLAAKRELAGGHKLSGDVIASPDGTSVVIITSLDSELSWLDLVSQADKREGVTSVTYTPHYFAAKDVSKLVESVATAPGSLPDDRFRVVLDDLTGSLIVTATASQHERIASLLVRLDSTQQAPNPFRSYPIKSRPVNDVLATLRQLIAAGILDTDAGAGRAEVTAGASQSTARAPLLPQSPVPSGPTTTMISPQPSAAHGTTTTQGASTPTRPVLSLTADEATNTLIAIGEPRVLNQLESLLVKLDVRQPQVMLEVTLVSLTDSDAVNLGVELERLWQVGETSVRLSSLFGLSTGPAATRTVGDAVGLTGAVLNPGEFSAIVQALQSINKGRSLSNPKLLVTNNEKAVFSSTIQEPVQSLTRTSSSDSTFAYAGTENAGTTISVKPQIAQGDHLVLTYSIKLSSFVGASASPGLPPPKQENAVDSVATIPDGHIVVVGGLDLLTDSKAESRVPLIAQIPIIGELFKNRSNSDSRSRFFVFIKATVLRSSSFEDLKYISEVDAGSIDVDDGYPVVTPRVIR